MSQAPTIHAVVITGVSSGIGYATAKLALERGAQAFGSVRRREDADRLAPEFGERFTALLFDVRDERAVRAEAERVRAALGGRTLSGLVNNVGTAIPGPLLLQPVEEIRAQIEINLMSAFIVTQAFAPLLGADRSLSGAPGRVVNMSSIGGRIGQPFTSAYVASKHGLEGFSDTIRRELQLFGIDVIIVAPGAVRTPVWSKIEPQIGRFAGTPYGGAFDAALRAMIRAGRKNALEPRAVAEIVWRALTAASPKARYAPARNPLVEQGLARVLPRRLADWAMGRALGLKPSSK
jgi:NAD(P)-dependent dehydrogenase (short-subunit alcohol dehydrogenase family)